jgi:hypothetical protein
MGLVGSTGAEGGRGVGIAGKRRRFRERGTSRVGGSIWAKRARATSKYHN